MAAVNKLAFGKRWCVLLFVIICFCSAFLGLAQENQQTQKPERFLSRSLRNISPEKAIQCLTQAGLGVVSQIPNTNTVLITAEPALLNKAKVMLELIDSSEPLDIQILPVFEEFANQPIKELIAERVKHENIDIGSFNEPPAKNASSKALIDTNNGQIIIIAEQDELEKIMSALQDILAEKEIDAKIKSEPNTVNVQTEPNVAKIQDVNTTAVSEQPVSADTNTAGNDQFFNGLMKSLAEAEKAAAELKTNEIKTESAQEAAMQKDSESHPEIKYSEIVDLQTQQERPEMTRFKYEPKKVEIANESLELDLPETLNIIDLIDLTGKYLGLDLLYDPLEVKGTVTLRVQKKITVGELYPLLESVLKFRGFVTSRKGNLVTIVPIAKADEIDPLLLDGGVKTVEYGHTVATRVFDLRYIDAQSAENLLNQMKLGAEILSIPAASKLFVTGYTYRMSRVEEVLAIIDQPGKLKQFRYRQLRFTMARNLVTQIQTLAEQLGTVSVTVAAPTSTQTFEAGPTRRGRPARITPQPQPTQAQQTTTTGPTVYLDADERTNRVLMIGLAEDLEIIERLIESLDVAQQDLRTFRLYQMQYIGAEEMMEKLIQLNIISGQKTTAEETTRQTLSRRQQQQQQQQQPQDQQLSQEAVEVTEEGLVEKPSVVIVELTNSLLINATAEQHAQIATIIAYVDSEPEEAATNYVVYPLENQDPGELASVLNQLITEIVSETQGDDNKIVTTYKTKPKTDEIITIIPDAKTYSLVVYATKKNQQWISSIIKNLDEYRPQVLLDCTLVEISRDDSFAYELDMITKTYGGRQFQTGSPVSILGGTEFSNDRLFDAGSRPNSTDAITAFFNSGNVQMLLKAIEKKGYGRIMSQPKILVNDNQEGQIRTERKTSVAQVSSNTQIIEGGGAITTDSVTFNEYIEGVTLIIKPHISKGDMLRLEISLNRTDFEEKGVVKITDDQGDKTYPSPPDLISADIITVSTVPNGTTIILGGLETIDQSKTHSKVPLIGDIPLVGGLFRGIKNSDTQTKLYIFVTANIIRPSDQVGGLEDIRRVSSRYRNKFENMEGKFQSAQDWPGIKPKPMEPINILEEE